ncbi:PepSY domain-containing protein [Salinithrix halophila]|uniref:PepSY domain-containing protein n=1 Tax=Salinithrix halophila TaxID=1485204 RepID=A0ABV8JJ75_9BACL
MLKKTWLGVLAGAVIIAGAGFGANKIFADEKDSFMTTQEAVKKVEERYPGKVKEIERDGRGARAVYEIELEGSNGEYDIKMDARTGKMLKVQQDQNVAFTNNDDDTKGSDDTVDRGDHREQNQSKEKIGYEQAEKIALGKFDGKVSEIELDQDDGRWIYDVGVKNGRQEADLEIDAYTGKVLFLSVENHDSGDND